MRRQSIIHACLVTVLLALPMSAGLLPSDPDPDDSYPLPDCSGNVTLSQLEASAGCEMEPPEMVSCETNYDWGIDEPGITVGSGDDLCNLWVGVDLLDLVNSLDCEIAPYTPTGHVTCGNENAHLHCTFASAGPSGPTVNTIQCVETLQFDGWVQTCTISLSLAGVAGGVSCNVAPPVDGPFHCIPTIWSIIDEPGLTVQYGNCGAALAFDMSEFKADWAECYLNGVYPWAIYCYVDPPQVYPLEYPGPSTFGCVFVLPNPYCHVDGERFPGEDVDCNNHMMFPPGFGCRSEHVDAYCDTGADFLLAGVMLINQASCTVRVGDLVASCDVWVQEQDGWTGADCIAGVSAPWYQCTQAEWGVHEDDLVVGGYHGCSVVAKIKPLEYVPFCFMDVHPGSPGASVGLTCTGGPVFLQCVAHLVPPQIPRPIVGSMSSAHCVAHVDEVHGIEGITAWCGAQSDGTLWSTSAACNVKREGLDCTVAVWFGPGIPPQCWLPIPPIRPIELP